MMIRLLQFLIFFVAIALAQDKPLVAVLQVKVDKEVRAKKIFTESELAKLTSIVRSQASKALGRNVEIMSDATIERLVGASLEECSGANCLAGFIQTISADYGVQPILSIAFGQLEFRIEVASKSSLLAEPSKTYDPKESSKAALAKESQELSREAIGAIQVDLGLGEIVVEPKRRIIDDVNPDEVGTVVSIELTDGAAAVLVNNKIACTYKERCSKELSHGKHSVTVSRDAYRDSTFGITVPSGSNRYVLALQSKAGVLTLRASDAESGEDVVAQVVIDGSEVGTTPWSGKVAMTAKKIVLKANGYEDAEVSERAEEGKKRAVTAKMRANPKTVVSQTNSANKFGTFTDLRDGKTYKTVVIGSQTWMAENLNYGTMMLGSKEQNNDSKVEKYCYEDQSTNCLTDGGLYQWAEAMALPSSCNEVECTSKIKSVHQGVCPNGWHIPKGAEWNTLATNLGGDTISGKKLKLNATGFSQWDGSNYNDGNSTGFSAFPAGNRNSNGDFLNRGNYANFWGATESNASVVSYRYLSNRDRNLSAFNYRKYDGFSVRCVSDL